MVVPCKDKQKQNKWTTETWSIREIAVAARPSETKLLAHQEKLLQSKTDKPQPCCFADSVQSLWPATQKWQSCPARTRFSFLDLCISNPGFPSFSH